MNPKLRTMIGHGGVILLIGMCAGMGLLMSLLGGIELIPGSIIPFTIPGDTGAWARTHVGGILNGVLVMLVAVVLNSLGAGEGTISKLRWMLVGTGYANTIFYWGALFAPNRALSIADNKFGASNAAAVIGLVPALIFVVISIIAVVILVREAFSSSPGR